MSKCFMLLLLQGVLSPQDAVLAVQAGASGVIVSNHGGRALDGSLSSIESLAPVVKVVSCVCAVCMCFICLFVMCTYETTNTTTVLKTLHPSVVQGTLRV